MTRERLRRLLQWRKAEGWPTLFEIVGVAVLLAITVTVFARPWEAAALVGICV